MIVILGMILLYRLNINVRPCVFILISNRNEARIDESFNRLDTEIRRVGRIRRQEVDEILEDIKEMSKFLWFE